MTPRAPALPLDERRAALVAATTPLLKARGRAVSTKEIAAAAGVAEGTIFRAFDSKDDLVDACLRDAFDPLPLIAALEGIDRDQPLRDRALALTSLTQARLTEVFELLVALGLTAPPEHLHDHHHDHDDAVGRSWQARTLSVTEELLTDPEGRLRVTPREFMRYLRLLTFSGSHPYLTHHDPLTPEEIVDTLLHGLAHTTGPRGT